MTVKVCDALCGCGKTSSCINMMNKCTDKKFIFVTQYLDEVDRIINSCSSRGFVTPIADEEHGTSKLYDVRQLIAEGHNIATTHALFLSYTDEIKELIEQQHYVLVLDEVVDVIQIADISKCDIELLRESATIQEEGDHVIWLRDEYADDAGHPGRFKDEMLRAKSQNFMKYDDQYFFWAITPELFTSFDEVYVLTYLFESQNLRYFFDMYGIKYELIGSKLCDDGYQFCPPEEMNRARELRDKIHIIDSGKINNIGSSRNALSYSWFSRNKYANNGAAIEELKKNLGNVFKNIFKSTVGDSLWTSYKETKGLLSGRGYSGAFVPYNLRASNKYSDRHHLAYCVNNFPRPFESNYFRAHGANIDSDMYALSILVQWVFRSAIRNNEEIWLYIPSVRMRSLFMAWLDNLAEGKDLEPVSYTTPRKNYYTPVAVDKRRKPSILKGSKQK